MAGFPCHGLRALSTVLASADTHAALEEKAGSLMVSLTGRRDAKRLQAIVANLYVRDGVVYARSDVQVHEQLVVPKEVSLFVAVVQLLAKHGFYAGVKKSGNLGVEQVSPLIDAFQDRIDDLLDATVVAHKALPTGNDVCAQVKAVYDVLTSIGWRDLPTNPDVTRAFLKSERDVLFGPPGDAGRRFVFSIAGEQHVCWTRFRHIAVAAASKARGIHVYYCHRWREPRHTSTHPSGTPGMSQAHEEKEKEKEKETSDSNVNGVDVDDNSNSLSAPADVSSSRAFVDDMAPHESIIAAVLPFDEAVHDGSDSDSEDDGDEGDGSHGIDVAEDSGVTQQLSTIPKHLLPPSFPELRGAPDVPVPPPPPATDPPRPAPSRTARERRSLNTHKGCSCRAKLVVIEGKEAIALVACHDHTGHTVGSVEDRKHLPVHPAVERMIADQASKRCTLLSRGEVAKYASSCRLTYVKHRRRVLFENETRSASLPGYAPGTSAASPAFEVRKRGDLLQSVTEHRKAFCLCNSFLPPSEHGAVPVVTCMTCCDVYHVSCVSNALWYDHGVDHDTWRCQPCVKNGTARMSDALNMCAESGLPFNISDFRPWVTKEDFKNSRKAVNASSRSYRSSVDDDIRVLQQYHESVAFPSTYIRTCEMANTTKLQELEFMVISPKMLAFAKKNRGVLSVLHIDFTHNTTTSSVQLGSIVGANADTRGTGIPLGHMFYLPGSVQTQYNDKTSALYNVYNAWSEAIDAGIDGYRVTRCHMMDKDVASLNATLMLMKKRLRSALHRNKDVLDAEIHTLSSMPCMSDDGTAKAVVEQLKTLKTPVTTTPHAHTKKKAETHGLLAPHVSELFDAGVVHGLAHLLVAEFHAASAKLISADSCGKWNNAASELWWNLLQVLVGTPTAPDPLNSVIGVKLQDVGHMRLGVSCESKNYKATRLTAKIDVLRLRLHNDDGIADAMRHAPTRLHERVATILAKPPATRTHEHLRQAFYHLGMPVVEKWHGMPRLRNVHALKRVLDHGTKSGSPILHHFVGASKGVTEPFGAVAVERRFVAFTPPSTQMLDIAEAAWHVVLLEMGHDRLRDHGVKAISEMKLSSEQNPFMKRALVASSRTLRLTRGRGEADADVGEDLWWDAWCNAVDGNQEEHTVHLWCNICSCGNTFCAHLMLARKRHEDMFHRVQVWDDDMLSLYKGQAHRDGGADTWTELDEAGFEYGPCNSPSEEPLAPFQSHVPASPDMRQSLEEASMCAYAVSLSLAKMANGECDTVTPKAAADYRDRLFAMLSSIRNVERGVVGVRAQSEHWMTRSVTASEVQMSNAAARDVHSSDFHEIMRSALSSGAHARLFTFMKGVVGPTATPSATQTQASPCQNLVNAAMQAIAELPSETVTPSPPVAARRASKGKEKALSQTEEHVLPSQVLPSPTETGSQPATRKSLHVTFTQESDVHIAPTPEECKRHFLAVLRRDAFDELVYVTEEEFNKFSVHTKEWYDTQVLKANILECGIKDIVSGHHLWTLKPGGWLKDSIVTRVSKQNNGFDCALYTALNVEAVLLDVSPNVVTQRRVNELRKSTRVKLKDCFLGQEQDWWVEEEDDDEVAAKIEELHTVGHVLVHVMSDADAWKIHHALVTTLANNTLVAWDGIFDNVVAQDAQDGQETFERDMINVNDAFTNHVTGGEDLLQRIESYHNRVDRYMGGRTCPEGAVLLRSCPERAGNNARTGLPNFKKGPCQAPHVDYTDVYEDVADDDVPLVVIIAIQEGTKVRIWPESTKGKGIWIAKKKKNENLTKGLLDYVDVHIPVGYALIMRGDLVHAGVGYDIVQLRLHKEYKHHSKKKGVCKKYSPQTALWHPELFKELYKSGKIT
ncbi:hypothetical protein RI054_07g35970 [Pseudoscourfieldia marina]